MWLFGSILAGFSYRAAHIWRQVSRVALSRLPVRLPPSSSSSLILR